MMISNEESSILVPARFNFYKKGIYFLLNKIANPSFEIESHNERSKV
jgi:hypothetical protein